MPESYTHVRKDERCRIETLRSGERRAASRPPRKLTAPLRARIEDRLRQDRSPEQVAAQLKLEKAQEIRPKRIDQLVHDDRRQGVGCTGTSGRTGASGTGRPAGARSRGVRTSRSARRRRRRASATGRPTR